MYVYYPSGVCSQMMELEIEGDVLKDVIITGGCNGNLQAITELVKGLTLDEIIEKLEGIKCGFRETSCPDQLCKAIKAAMNENKSE